MILLLKLSFKETPGTGRGQTSLPSTLCRALFLWGDRYGKSGKGWKDGIIKIETPKFYKPSA